jgi:hypothetical protein
VIVPIALTNQNSSPSKDAAISYSIPTTAVRMSVTQEVRKLEVSTDKRESKTMQLTTIVAE